MLHDTDKVKEVSYINTYTQNLQPAFRDISVQKTPKLAAVFLLIYAGSRKINFSLYLRRFMTISAALCYSWGYYTHKTF